LRAKLRGDLARAAADAVLVVDAPPDHDRDFDELPLRRIRLLGPNATPARRKTIAAAAEGFVYLVALAGVTGAGQGGDLRAVQQNVAAMRKLTRVPLCVGFGVKSGDDAHRLAPLADGIIAGSVFIDVMRGDGRDVMRGAHDPAAAVAAKVRELRAGLDR
jgi:tryptophan synthase alpha chain